MPAFVFIIFWFIMQISGFLGGDQQVAWEAHISGFIAGAVLHPIFTKSR
jgi:membrane associated rhomboid family serine protease